MLKGKLKNKINFKWSIRTKLTFVMTVLIVSLVIILTFIHISFQKAMMERELNKRIILMKENMKERGKGFISNLTMQVGRDIASFNFSGVMEAIKSGVEKNREIKYAILMDSTGLVFVHTLRPDLIRNVLIDHRTVRALNNRNITIIEYKEKGDSVFEIINPVQISTKPWGVLRLVYTQRYLKMEIKNSNRQILTNINKMVYNSILTSLGFIIVCVLIVFILAMKFSAPLIVLTRSAKKLSKGDFSVSSSIKINSKDEVGVLASSFIEMSNELKNSYEQLEESNKTLEINVLQRTDELNAKNIKLIQVNQKLEETLKELQDSQSQLIQSEKMAVLGQLVAGIAHEINTPLGVIRGAGSNISNALDETLDQFPGLFKILSPHILESFFILLKKGISSGEKLSSREARKLRRKLSTELEELEVESSDSIADTLVDIGIYDDIEQILPLLKDRRSSKLLKLAYNFSGLKDDSSNIIIAVERAAKIVFALKKFAHQDQMGEKVSADIADDLDTVLTLYNNQIKQNVELIKNYKKIPPVLCYRDELNQVWTNLIHNALQAMEYKGRLIVSIDLKGNNLVVSVTDNGPGIPDNIKKLIFEPFFTTKALGEGSGLGLDISKKIIEKHNGKILVDSEPGKTTFKVILPVQ